MRTSSVELAQLNCAPLEVIEETLIVPGWVGAEVLSAACVVALAGVDRDDSSPEETVDTVYVCELPGRSEVSSSCVPGWSAISPPSR